MDFNKILAVIPGLLQIVGIGFFVWGGYFVLKGIYLGIGLFVSISEVFSGHSIPIFLASKGVMIMSLGVLYLGGPIWLPIVTSAFYWFCFWDMKRIVRKRPPSDPNDP